MNVKLTVVGWLSRHNKVKRSERNIQFERVIGGN